MGTSTPRAEGAKILFLVFVFAGIAFAQTWVQMQILTASNKAADDRFGVSVSLTDNYALVGAYGADPGGVTSAGAAYVFVRSGTTWTEQAILTASNKEQYDFFGSSVPLTDNYALVGASGADPGGLTDAGSAYVFVRSGTTWSEQAILTASNKAANDRFGWSVSLTDNYALVGAYYAFPGGISYAGAAYVFVRSGTTWTEQAILTASNKAVNDFFGYSVSLTNENTALIGAPVAFSWSNPRTYTFTRDGTTWTESAISNTCCPSSSDVAQTANYKIEGDLATVGGLYGAGHAIVYFNSDAEVSSATQSRSRTSSRSRTLRKTKSRSRSRSRTLRKTQSPSRSRSPQESGFTLQHRAISISGSSGKGFGYQVAAHGDILVISKHECDVSISSKSCGRVYVLKKQGDSWILLALLRHPGDVRGRAFGRTLTFQNGWLFISAESIVNPNLKSYIYSFKLDDSDGSLIKDKKLYPPHSVATSFGRTLATDGSFVAVGAPLSSHANGNIESGTVVVYQIILNSNWGKQGSIIQPSSLVANERFGSSLAINNEGILAIGNECDDPTCSAVYIYHLHNRHLFVYQKLQQQGRQGFGKALAFWDNKLYITAPEDSTSLPSAGSVHVYEPSGLDSFVHVSQIVLEDIENSRAGSSICISERFLVISRFVCPSADATCSNQGSVDVFTKTAESWSFGARISHGLSNGLDRYGSSLACTDDFFAVGAPLSGITFSDGGAVHVYSI